MENDVWFDEPSGTRKPAGTAVGGRLGGDWKSTQRWWKRTNLYFHVTWLEYFHRIAMHQWLFPEAPLTFEGFLEHDGEFLPIVSQPHVCATRGAQIHEVREALEEFGFRHCGGYDFKHPGLGIRVEDVHDENAVLHPCGEVAVFDPVIYLIDRRLEVIA